MPTIGAQLTATGVQVPDYADILQQLKIQFWQIYGSDADLDDDSPDGQWIAALAQIIFDCGMLAQAVYAGFSPLTAQGTQLSSLVKINGLKRETSSASTCDVTLTGQAGTVIENGVIGDNQNLGTQWTLPASVTIGDGGTVDATVTCTTQGAVSAGAGTLTQILTPTRGWQSVTNAAVAVPGQPIETDPALRARQATSTSLPAQAVLDSMSASILALNGVSRMQAYENDTDVNDGNGAPPHCIYFVVEGGDPVQIADAIALKKTPGTRAYGTTTETVIDQAGVPNVIGFFVLENVELEFEINITPLANFASSTEATIQQAVADFVNSYAIGEESYTKRLYIAAGLGGVGLGATFVITDVQQSIKGNPLGTADIPIAFNQAAFTVAADVSVVVA